MTALELSNLCVLLEKFLNQTRYTKFTTAFYGRIFDAGVKACNGDAVKFYHMCESQKEASNGNQKDTYRPGR